MNATTHSRAAGGEGYLEDSFCPEPIYNLAAVRETCLEPVGPPADPRNCRRRVQFEPCGSSVQLLAYLLDDDKSYSEWDDIAVAIATLHARCTRSTLHRPVPSNQPNASRWPASGETLGRASY